MKFLIVSCYIYLWKCISFHGLSRRGSSLESAYRIQLVQSIPSLDALFNRTVVVIGNSSGS